tara:strand:+ start:1702 stop:2409 length:708 start_codon:yes stop_codon:yes gene_type:complete
MQNKKTRLNIEKIITESLKSSAEQKKEYYLFGKLLYLKDPFISSLNVQATIETLESKIPEHLFAEVDEILVGDFDFLHERSIEAAYKDGAIYITNQIQTEDDLVENILHEISHSLEYPYGQMIYGDMKIHSEFLGKRKRLESILRAEGYDTTDYDFSSVEYEETLDAFFLSEVGYPALNNLIMGLFVSPYAATSLKEYWAVGFEDYFIEDREYLQKVSPQLFNKIEGVITYEDLY